MQSPLRLLATLAALIFALSATAQQPTAVVVLMKASSYEQTGPDATSASGFGFLGLTQMISAVSYSSVTLVRPNGSEPMLPADQMYTAAAEFSTKAALDSIYPDGSYTVRFSSGSTVVGSYVVAVTAAMPAPPHVTNYAAAQAIPGGQPFTIMWDPFVGATPQDLISLSIESTDGTFTYQSPGVGQAGGIPATSTAWTGTLPTNKHFRATLGFFRLSQGDGRIISLNSLLFGGVYTETQFNLATIEVIPTPTITLQPQSRQVATGASVTFSTSARVDGSDLRYQWKRDGQSIPGATSASYTIPAARASDMGFYSVTVSGTRANPIDSAVAILTVTGGGTSRLSNLSARVTLPVGGEATAGFAVAGSGSKKVLLRAVGPQLNAFGIAGLPDPKLDVIPSGTSTPMLSNDDWGGGATLRDAFASVGAFALSSDTKSAAVVTTLNADGIRLYSMRITSATAGSGVMIAEVYDTDGERFTGRLVNVSTRANVSNDSTFISGFAIAGSAPKRILIRAVGPTLATYGVRDALADPQLSVVPLGKSFTVAANDNWGGSGELWSAFMSAGAFPLSTDSKDAAVVLSLPPGGYTVTVSGVGGLSGNTLLEIYDLDP